MDIAIPPTLYPDGFFTSLQLGSQSIIVVETVSGLAPPIFPSDAVNKEYVDTLIASVPAAPANAVQYNSDPEGQLKGTSDFLYHELSQLLELNASINLTSVTSDIVFTQNTGVVTGLANPVNPLDAANKQYVDNISFSPGLPAKSLQFNSNPAGTFTGSSDLTYDQPSNTLTLNGDIDLSSLTSIINFSNNTGIITGVANPINPLDVANKSYVDSAIGLSPGLPFNSIQFNNGGILGGSANLLWNSGTDTLEVINIIQAGTLTDGTMSITGGNVTNATITSATNNVAAKSLVSSTGLVQVNTTTPSVGQALVATSATQATWQNVSTTAGGANTQVQYNNAGAFAGSPSFTWNQGTTTLTATTLSDGAGSTISAGNVTGSTLTSTVATGTAPLVVSSTTPVLNLTASNVTTNANLTGPITSVGNATSVASQTGTGSVFVMNTSPTLVTPNIGAATGTSLNATGTLTGLTLTDGVMSSTLGAITNATITDITNNVAAKSLVSSTGLVQVDTTTPTSGQALVATSATTATWQSISGGSAAGLNTQVQYNNAGVFGASSDFTWNQGSTTLGLNGILNNTGTTNATSTSTGSIVTAGGIGITKDVYIGGVCYATEFLTTSDERLKFEIESINNFDLDKLNKINGYSYFLKDDDDLKYGFLAGELEENGLDNLIKEVDNFKRVNYQSFIPLLLEKIKTLEKRISELEKI
jgi:hypothetical protein